MLVLLACAYVSARAQSSTKPLTWQRDYFPEFRIEMAEADLARMMSVPVIKDAPDETKYPIILRYQGAAIEGTIRLRIGNASKCGEKRQFRLDFPRKLALPDGYVTDRFETDHGICNTLNEWMGWQLLDEAAQRRPELNILRKHANVVALYFNGKLYHVQTLLEDVNKDLAERYLQTRKVELFKYGCYGVPRGQTVSISPFCLSFALTDYEKMLDAPAYLYSTALVQLLGSSDMYPAYPWNSYLAFNQETERTHFLTDDLDMCVDFTSGAEHDPFNIVYTENAAQKHFEAFTADQKWGELYRQYVVELSALLAPSVVTPLVSAKYEQVRATLLASPELPFGPDYYDRQYRTLMPEWAAQRTAYLRNLFVATTRDRLAFNGILLSGEKGANYLLADDFSHDGHPDIVIANQEAGTVTLTIGLDNRNNEYWWAADVVRLPVGGKPSALAVLDFDDDGWNDLAVVDRTNDLVTIWRNQRNASFSKAHTFAATSPRAVYAVRLNGETTLLFIVTGDAMGTIRRYRLRRDDYTEIKGIPLGVPAQAPAWGKLDAGRSLDAVTVSEKTAELITVYDVVGDSPRVVTQPLPVIADALALADFDQDGWLDVAAVAADANQLLRLRNLSGSRFELDNQVALPTGFWRGDYRTIAAADFDGNRVPDVAITDYREGIIRIFRGALTGFANARSEYIGTSYRASATLAADVNEDGRPDVIAASSEQGRVNLHINRGSFPSLPPKRIVRPLAVP